MIVIHIRLAAISLAAIVLAMIMAAIAILGLILGIHGYKDTLSLRISALLTGSLAILGAVSSLATVAWPYNSVLLALNLVVVGGLGGSGIYYLATITDPFKRYSGTALTDVDRHLELAFIVLWVLALILYTGVNVHLASLVWVTQTPIDSSETGPNNGNAYWLSPDFSDQEKFSLQKMSFPPMDLASPIDIPQVGTDMPNLSPRLTWPSTINSIRPSNSLSSLRSALDGNGLPFTEANPYSESFAADITNHTNTDGALMGGKDVNGRAINTPDKKNHSNSPTKKLIVKLMRSASTNDTDLPLQPSSPGRSSVKLHLSRSTFSLKRERNRQVSKQPSLHGQANAASYAFPHTMGPPLTPTDIPDSYKLLADPNSTASPFSATLAHSSPNGVSISEIPKGWLIIPNDSSGESRSASGSSQLTGRVFPTSEYNRKINAAGFQKDEPVLVRIEDFKETLSQYDFEQAIKRKHLRKHTQSQ